MKQSQLPLCVLLFLVACQDVQLAPAARFRGPTDAVLAGTTKRNVFLSAGVRDALYVMDAGDSLSSLNFGVFVRAPNKFFPLEIPVGRLPSSMVASSNMRYVLIAYAHEGHVGLLDADSQQLVVNQVDRTDHKVKVGAGPTAILRLPQGQQEGDRFVVTNSIDGSVSEIALVETDGVPTLSLVRTIENVGSITRAVLSGDGATLYGADSSSSFVHRVDLVAGSSVDLDVGGPSLDVAVAPFQLGERLFVARADLLSIAVFDANTGFHVDTNPAYAPLGPEPFRDIYIGDVPGRLLFTRQFPTEVYCTVAGADPKYVSSYITVATDSGEIYFIDTETNTLVSRSFCQGATLTANPINLFQRAEDSPAVSPFEPCASSRNRDECLKLGDDNSGVFASPGNTLNTSIRLVYEGVLPNAARDNGGGTFNADGISLRDPGSRLAEAGISIEMQDRLVILTPPLASVEGCSELYGDGASLNLREFTVTSLEDGAGGKGLTFTPALRPECFPNEEGGIAYVVRAAKSFLVTSQIAGQVAFFQGRLVDGQGYGGPYDSIRFKLKDNISSRGVRDELWEFFVSSPFTPLIRGQVTQQDSAGTQVLTPAGRIPTAIMYLDFPGTEQLATLVTFGGNDVVIAYDTRGVTPLTSISGIRDDAIVIR